VIRKYGTIDAGANIMITFMMQMSSVDALKGSI
jgi:hypothetical protein